MIFMILFVFVIRRRLTDRHYLAESSLPRLRWDEGRLNGMRAGFE